MTEAQLADRVNASPELSALRDDIASELAFHSSANVRFDPVTIIMIISIIVQVIIHCLKNNNDEDLVMAIRDVRTLPPRRLMRLRRRLNRLWRERCGGDQAAPAAANPLLSALYKISDNADDATIRELIQLAKET